MAKIILDFGSGNTHKNNWDYLTWMIDELRAVDTGKHEVIIKHQLFLQAGDNIPLDRELFRKAYDYAKELGYQTTSSVFDKESLDFLLQFEIPFVKIANNRKLDWLIGEVPRKIPIVVSIGSREGMESLTDYPGMQVLFCVSEYPAKIEGYEEIKQFSHYVQGGFKAFGISDHTANFGLWYRYQPQIIEWHYVLGHDANNLDGGLFARTPSMLAEVL